MIQYLLHIYILFLFRMVAAQGMNLYFGYAGLIGLCNIAFVGIGAYSGAIMIKDGASIWMAFGVSGVIVAILAFLLGLTSIRLRQDFLGMATFGFSQIVLAVMYNWSDLTNGALGIAGIPRPDVFGLSTASTPAYALFVTIFAALMMLIMYLVVRSHHGRILEAIRDDEEAAKSIGIKTNHYKLFIFTFGLTIAGLTGVLLGPYIAFLHPVEFAVDLLALQLVIIMLGGAGTFRGPILGAIFITVLFEVVKFMNLPPTAIGPLRVMFFSGVFLITLRFFPAGLAGFWKHGKRFSKSFTKY